MVSNVRIRDRHTESKIWTEKGPKGKLRIKSLVKQEEVRGCPDLRNKTGKGQRQGYPTSE